MAFDPTDFEELSDVLSGLFAFDTGCVDSGIKDEWLRTQVVDHFNSLSEEETRILITEIAREFFMTDEMIAQGYGLEDCLSFARWFYEDLFFGVH